MEAKTARETILSVPIGDVLNDLAEGMRTANVNGDTKATVRYANYINTIEDVVDVLTAIEMETGLYSEGKKQCQKSS